MTTTATVKPSPIVPSGRLLRAADVPEILRSLGGVPPERVLLSPPPGTATEVDLVRLVDGDRGALCELVSGTLVEKPVSVREALLAMAVAAALREFVLPRKLGFVLGPDAMIRMRGGNVRLPDVSFVAWADIAGDEIPPDAIGAFPPTIAVEVLSAGNTPAEMTAKRNEYFASGTKLVWEIDLRDRTVRVCSPPAREVTLLQTDTLTGGDVLAGFALPLAKLFAELDIRRQ